MGDRTAPIKLIALLLAFVCCVLVLHTTERACGAADLGTGTVELARYEDEFSSLQVELALIASKPAIALLFEGTDDLHYYAKPETAPAPGLELKASARSDSFEFGPAVFPKWHIFTDSLKNEIEVYSGGFVVYIPMTPKDAASTETTDVEVTVSGIACTSMACLAPFEHKVQVAVDYAEKDSWKVIDVGADSPGPEAASAGPGFSAWIALPLAFLAGLVLNLMPCVWPVLPLIVMRIVEQAKRSKKKSAKTGLIFCIGILLFFACLAGANIILKLAYGTALQWGDQFRSPLFVGGMSLLLVVLALSMFGVLTITIPSSIAGESGSSGALATGALHAASGSWPQPLDGHRRRIGWRRQLQ